jgi:hypothetical protein
VGETRSAMALLRLLLVPLISIGLYFAATAVAQSPVEWYSGGGAAAGTAPTSPGYKGGGALAPSLGGTATTPTPNNTTIPTTPNLPPPTEVPKPDVSPPAEAARAASAPSARAEATGAQAAAPTAAQPASGGLPFTGLALVAVVGAGLCLLLAGLALRPRPARR